MLFSLVLTGERPMLQHNGRLSNPLDRYTRQIKSIVGKRNKTDEDLAKIMQIEARGGCWETRDQLLGVPTSAVWRCLYDAAKAFKRGEDLKRGLLFNDDVEPVLVDGEPVSCDDFIKDSEHLFLRSVKIGRNRTMRARPRVPQGWVTVHKFELLADVIDQRNLAPIIERAGRLVGLGDWRPTYGRFTARMEEAA